jgi:hypothetical protein
MRLFCLVAALVFAASVVSAYDIITVPTANLLKQGEIELAYYHAFLRGDNPKPEFMHVETLYVGVTDRLELDAHSYAIDNNDTSVIVIGNVKLLSESKDGADVVFGCKNMTATPTVDNPPFSSVNYRKLSADQSYYLCAAKTFQLNNQPAGPPFLRVQLSLGTPDWTIDLAKRHQGIFGGVQYVITPHIGVSVFDDSRNIITGICYFPTKSNLMLRAGTFASDWLLGIAYMWTPRW